MERAGVVDEMATAPDDEFNRNVKHLIDNFFSGDHPRFCPIERAWNPPTDIFESAEALHIKMEVAGVPESDIELKVSHNYLIIRGRREDERHIKRENFHLMEIQYGHFERVFRLPVHMEENEVSAVLRNGFLLVSVPKNISLREYRIEIE